MAHLGHKLRILARVNHILCAVLRQRQDFRSGFLEIIQDAGSHELQCTSTCGLVHELVDCTTETLNHTQLVYSSTN